MLSIWPDTGASLGSHLLHEQYHRRDQHQRRLDISVPHRRCLTLATPGRSQNAGMQVVRLTP